MGACLNDARVGVPAADVFDNSSFGWPWVKKGILTHFVLARDCQNFRELLDLILLGHGAEDYSKGPLPWFQCFPFQCFPFHFVVEVGVLSSCGSKVLLTLPVSPISCKNLGQNPARPQWLSSIQL